MPIGDGMSGVRVDGIPLLDFFANPGPAIGTARFALFTMRLSEVAPERSAGGWVSADSGQITSSSRAWRSRTGTGTPPEPFTFPVVVLNRTELQKAWYRCRDRRDPPEQVRKKAAGLVEFCGSGGNGCTE